MNKSLLYLSLILTISNLSFAENNLRKLNVVNTTTSYPCLTGSGQLCVCPGNCMLKPSGNSTYCKLKDCWDWDKDQQECKGVGPKFTPAIVLQAIPFTGAFGSGFGNMGRWDLFGIGSAIWGGGFGLICLCMCCHMYSGSDGESMGSVCSYCFTLILSLGITAYWIWGIVVIAEKSVLGPDGCPFIEGS
tara:strand:+ start:1636 stop:2202 length:567 start_codon:yes stop_codon:yes gene_type:complete